MPNGDPCPRTLTFRINQGAVSAHPPRSFINTECQQIRVNLVTDGSGTYNNPPIEFPWPAPGPGYSQWKGTVQQTGPNQWLLDAKDPLSPGTPPKLYKYNILWSGGTFDPDIENDPYPPGAKDKKDKDDKDDKDDRDRDR